MSLLFVSPRQVLIGDAASFAGTTPRAIRHYHDIGLLPEPERGSDDRRRYGYEDMIRLLWIRRMADAGIALEDIRDAFAGTAPAGADTDRDVAVVLERLERALVVQEAEVQRRLAAVQRMRTRGSRSGLLSDVVTDRLMTLPEGSLREADLDTLLVTERILGPLGAAFQATRFIVLATHPRLREESDRIDAAEEALDDTVAVDDPRVGKVASERHAFEQELLAVVEGSGLVQDEEALLDSWQALHPDPHPADDGEDEAAAGSGAGPELMSALGAARKMPYDFSAARLRCIELAEELASQRAQGGSA